MKIINVLLVPSELLLPINTMSSAMLARCEEGLGLWRRGGFDVLLVTGGLFLPPDHQTRPAAEIMRDWFVAEGVPEDRICVDRTSLDTYTNIEHGLQAIREQHPDAELRMTVCTQWQHALRFAITFWHQYRLWPDRHPVHQPDFTWGEWMQEFVLIAYTLLDPKGVWFIAVNNRKKRARAAAR